MFSDDVGSAREKENQNIVQKEMNWRTGVKGMQLPMVEQSALVDQ